MGSYSVRAIFCAFEVLHTVQACIGCAAARVSVAIEFLLGEDVSAVLCERKSQ